MSNRNSIPGDFKAGTFETLRLANNELETLRLAHVVLLEARRTIVLCFKPLCRFQSIGEVLRFNVLTLRSFLVC